MASAENKIEAANRAETAIDNQIMQKKGGPGYEEHAGNEGGKKAGEQEMESCRGGVQRDLVAADANEANE